MTELILLSLLLAGLLLLMYVDRLLTARETRALVNRLEQQMRRHVRDADEPYTRIYSWFRLLAYIETYEPNTRERARLLDEIRRRIALEKRSL